MHIKLILVLSLFGLLITTRYRLSRSVHEEMSKVKGIEVNPDIDLNEFYPFPKTISKVDPYVAELEP